MGKYEFIPSSCHQYNPSSLTYDIDTATKPLMLSPTKHLVSVDIKADVISEDLFVDVKIKDIVSRQGPLKAERVASESANIYTVAVYLKEEEIATVTPVSESLWFEPKTYDMEGGDDCLDYGILIFGKKGKIFHGQVVPALEGVEITVTRSDGEKIIRVTDRLGHYKFPTLDASYSYEIRPVKESYSFTGPDASGNLLAHKLAEVVVQVIDKIDSKPLQVGWHC